MSARTHRDRLGRGSNGARRRVDNDRIRARTDDTDPWSVERIDGDDLRVRSSLDWRGPRQEGEESLLEEGEALALDVGVDALRIFIHKADG